MPRFRHAVLGGTFDRFHAGHEALLATAFRVGERVSVGITSDRFLADHPKPWAAGIQAYTTRERAVRRWATRRLPWTNSGRRPDQRRDRRGCGRGRGRSGRLP